MALASSGSLTLNEIHIEAGGSSGTACTINDSDIRGLQPGAGKTINTNSGTAIEIADFHGATNDPRISLTGSAYQTGTLTIQEHYSSFSLGPYTSYTSRINGYIHPSVASSTASTMPSSGLGAWISSGNPNYRNINVLKFYQITSPGFGYGPSSTVYLLFDTAVFNSGWTDIKLYHPYNNFSNPYVFPRTAATYGYSGSAGVGNGTTSFTWHNYPTPMSSNGSDNVLFGSPRVNALQGTSYQTVTIS